MAMNRHRFGRRSLSVLGSIASLSFLAGLPAFAQMNPNPSQPSTDTPATPSPGMPSTDTPTTPPSTNPPTTLPSPTPGSNIPPTTNTPVPSPRPSAPATQTQKLSLTQLLQQASQQGSFTTLARLIQAAGLTNQLQSSGGSFTVFAPTDAAFAALPQGTLERLQRPENRALLRQILAYHVVPQTLTSSELQTGGLRTLGGGLAIRRASDRIIVNNGSIIQPDIRANNGIVHAINRVLIPTGLRQQLVSLR